MSEKTIETRLVYGFLDAGKTTFISDCIRNDYFHKYGKTLILCFEEGEEVYDPDLLSEKRAIVAYYDRNEDISEFCLKSIKDSDPDRIYVEMNSMIGGLREKLPVNMDISYAVTWIDFKTFASFYSNYAQMIKDMVTDSYQVTFRDCSSKELLKPYAQAFRLMNPKASYLRQDPMGYHEKAFDLFLPFSLDEDEIRISEGSYLPFWLDAFDHPEHYEGKTILFTDPVEIRKPEEDIFYLAGRVVMTCCMADLQFMGFEIASGADMPDRGWITLKARAETYKDPYGQKKLKLTIDKMCPAPAPVNLILNKP